MNLIFLNMIFLVCQLASFQKSHQKIIENALKFLIHHYDEYYYYFRIIVQKYLLIIKSYRLLHSTGTQVFLNHSLNLQHCYGQSLGALGGWPHLGGNTPTCPSSCRGCDSHRGSCSTASYTVTASPSSPLEGSVWKLNHR